MIVLFLIRIDERLRVLKLIKILMIPVIVLYGFSFFFLEVSADLSFGCETYMCRRFHLLCYWVEMNLKCFFVSCPISIIYAEEDGLW